jgi:hypothetical protein
MSMNLRRLLAAVLMLTAFGTLNIALALDDEPSRKSLAGLHGVHVLVEDLAPGAERTGLTRAAVQTDAELRLRQAGIPVLTAKEKFDTPGYPTLYINAMITANGSPWGYALSVGLEQAVQLYRDPTIVHAAVPTWSIISGGGYAVPADIPQSVRAKLRDMVDRFINAYLSVNPQQ